MVNGLGSGRMVEEKSMINTLAIIRTAVVIAIVMKMMRFLSLSNI